MIALPPGYSFDGVYSTLARELITAPTVEEPPHAMESLKDDPRWVTRERQGVVFQYRIHADRDMLQKQVKPNLPWAEEHFLERVGGVPLNPPPSHEHWPYARTGNEEHLVGGKFSHTYPERMWPKLAGALFSNGAIGIRYHWGDLNDLLRLLMKHPNTRQAYLPIWFPEDLTAANEGERVPCTLGYHFLLREGHLNLTYFIRSCDLVRFFRDDVYLACRLCQWVSEKLSVVPGILTMHIVSLHCFEGDLQMLRRGV